MSRSNQYEQENMLGGPAKVFDAMAAAIRAGDSYENVLHQFGFAETTKAKGGCANSQSFADAPSQIFLQICDEHGCTESFAEHSEVSWCEHRVHNSDIEYVRVGTQAVASDDDFRLTHPGDALRWTLSACGVKQDDRGVFFPEASLAKLASILAKAYPQQALIDAGLGDSNEVSSSAPSDGCEASDPLRTALQDLVYVVETMAPNLCGKAYQNANKVLAQTSHSPRVTDRLTNFKASELCRQHGYQTTGFVLSNETGPVCTVNLSNVQWYTNERPFPSSAEHDSLSALKADITSLQAINNALGQEIADLKLWNQTILVCLKWVDKYVHCAMSGAIKALVEKAELEGEQEDLGKGQS